MFWGKSNRYCKNCTVLTMTHLPIQIPWRSSNECEWIRFVVHCTCGTDILLVDYKQLTTHSCFSYVFARTVFNAVPFLHYIFLVVPRGVETGQWGHCIIYHKKICSSQKYTKFFWLVYRHKVQNPSWEKATKYSSSCTCSLFKHVWYLNPQQLRNKSSQWMYVSCIHIQSSYPKIPKIRPGAYIFQGPFWGEIFILKSIGLAI